MNDQLLTLKPVTLYEVLCVSSKSLEKLSFVLSVLTWYAVNEVMVGAVHLISIQLNPFLLIVQFFGTFAA